MPVRMLLMVIVLSMSASSMAQIIIDADDMPLAGDITNYANTTSLPDGVEPSLTGEAMIWDYSELAPEFNDVDTFLTVEETPVLFQFFFNNGFLYPDYTASHALKEVQVDLGLISVTDSYSYFKNDDDGYRNVGYGANINGVPSSVRNIPIDWIYEFPLEYLDESSSPSASELSIPGLGFFRHEQMREVQVEGWGTLLLPNQSYEVLKIKMIVNATDSVYVETLGSGFQVVQPETVIYQWLATGEGRPVLEINHQEGIQTVVRYRDDNASLIEEATPLLISVHPNPADDRIVLQINDSAIKSYTIIDNGGRIIRENQRYLAGRSISIEALEAGLYYMVLQSENKQYYSRFIKE